MLINIQNGKYYEARKLAERNISEYKRGRFANKGKYIYEYVVDYCVEREGI